MSSAAAAAATSPAGQAVGKGQRVQVTEQEIVQIYQGKRNELQALAQKIGELEGEADEHKLVIETLLEARAKDPSRKCFRLIGGVLVERTVKDVLPALTGNSDGLKHMLELLVKQYAEKEKDLQEFTREYGMTNASA
ncbi:hypothetical protein K437DRAFT_239795 [Tilletiaria anomala UBC 951]|uniref:Prefoldin beta-like protein n=1 Tax=Tilletiaria anomala (strain ATCC 24038 / CBS 436.72 / UBC 951) TaxID=1037660 RepID=A0A066VBV8_TILAU|nr:uncharacterized protein K437DRAFT_239795 [Tilletiaria anomala UBC 951]KDN38931.1 hypothetical protein K437DRAFT_239795 [Tilletiaria anomala UBC 951]